MSFGTGRGDAMSTEVQDDPPVPPKHADRLSNAPAHDQLRVGLSLIDLLFALVLSQVFIATNQVYDRITAAGWGQLIVATTLIVFSWIGYHNSRRGGNIWALGFFNRPLLQYVVDIPTGPRAPSPTLPAPSCPENTVHFFLDAE
jgi:hypothetical protein